MKYTITLLASILWQIIAVKWTLVHVTNPQAVTVCVILAWIANLFFIPLIYNGINKLRESHRHVRYV